MKRGQFVTIEGIDGVGKGTQLELIKAYLTEKNIDFITIREPGGSKISEKIRAILLDVENENMCPETELLLFNAARAQIVREKILPALEQGVWVISDRFFDSTLAYQVAGRGLDESSVREIIEFACGDLIPDLTIYLDLDPDTADQRLARRESETNVDRDRLENVDTFFDKRVRNKYLELVRTEPRIKLVSADASVEKISYNIKKILEPLVESFTSK